MCTNIGLFYFENGVFKHIAFDSNIESKAYFDIIDDGMGRYWMSSSFGVIQLDKAQLDQFVLGQTTRIGHRIYDDNDGMLNYECTGATRMFFDKKENKIYVPTFVGVSVIDLSIDKPNIEIPANYITSFEVDDEKVNLQEKSIKIDPGALRYTFDFTSLSYLSPSKVQFMYKLDGIDKDWIGPINDRFVEYTNLPKGKYTFHVKGTNSDGLWNDQGASLEFVVKPFIYETALFKIAGIAFILLLFWLIYRWRTKDITERNVALAKINTELDRFVYSASHDLRAPLASTMGLVIIARMESSEASKNRYLGLIEDCVYKMDHFINDIIEFSRNKNQEVSVEQFNIRDLVSEIFDNLKYLDHAETIIREIEVIGHEDVLSDKLRFKIILGNLIANAVTYSKNSDRQPFVKVKIENSINSILIEVIDNGIGIADEHKSKIFNMFYRANQKSKGSGLGLYIVMEALNMLGGKIDVNSELGKGTTFSVYISTGTAVRS